MGNFYTNYVLPDVTQSEVVAALVGRSAFVSPAVNNVVVVFDEKSESQNMDIINLFGAELSSKCKCPVLATMNHDDDVLCYGLFIAGQLADEYNSCPGYFDSSIGSNEPSGGDAAKLAAAFNLKDTTAIEKILRAPNEEYVFAVERHSDLAKTLDLPPFVAGSGYDYISNGELPIGLSANSLVRTA